jgi:cyclopropane fatty-acyl-phospholipid synthase-like methyltransferase
MKIKERIYTHGEYFQKNPTWHVEDSQWKAGQIIKIINENHINPKTICEIGCGAGEILNQLHLKLDNNISFIGYEISHQAFELCKHKEKDRLHFYCKDLLEDNNAFFDLVLCIDVFEHVEDYFSFLRNLCNKGQYKIFHIPLELSAQKLLRTSAFRLARYKVGHIHHFTKETALWTLKDTGYEILDYFFTAGSIDLPAKHFKTLLAKIPRKMMYSLSKDMAVRILGGFSLMVLTK